MRWITAVWCGILSTMLWAGEVSVTNTHFCCGSTTCVEEALADVKGISNISADQNAKSIQFAAANDKAAEAGIHALAKHGFFGQAKHGDKKLSFPATAAKKGDKSNLIVFYNVHLCCGACVTAAKKSLENVAGLSVIEIDRAAGKVTLKGAGIDTTKAIDALNAAGFYATLKPDEKLKDEKSSNAN